MIVLYIFLGIILFIFIMLHFPLVFNAEVSNEKKDVKVKYLFFTIYPLKEKNKNKKPKKRKNKKSKLSARKRKKLEKQLEEENREYEKALMEADLHSNRENSYKEFLPKMDSKSEQADEEIPDEESENVKQKEVLNKDTKKSGKVKKKKKKSRKDNSLSGKIDDLKQKWEHIKPYIPLTKKTVKKLFKSIWITSLELNLAVAKEDAYECAMAFGRINTAVFNALGVMKTFFSVSVKNINITSKFNSTDTEYYLKCKVKTRPSTIIAIAFCTLISFIKIYFKNRKKEKNHN